MEVTTDKELNTSILSDLFQKGASTALIAKDYGISTKALNAKIKEMQRDQGIILNYREVQHLQLTEIQGRLLNGITEDKIQCSSLTEIANAFRLFKDKELVMNGKATQITGIVGYLVELEKEEAQKKTIVITPEDAELLNDEHEEEIETGLPRL